jgi:lipopolysaccharide transport system permease protein
VLTPRPGALTTLLRDTWASRRLIHMMARRDFFARYRRASFGLLWAVIVPLVQALVLAVVLTRIAKVRTPGVPFPLFILAGTVAWSFFSGGLGQATTSIVDGSGITTKIYFPRAVLPLISVASLIYGLLLNIGILLLLASAWGHWPGVRLLVLPLACLEMLVLTSAFGLVLSAVQVYVRDVRYLLDAVIRAWFYLTPIFYPLTRLGGLRHLVEANPATGLVELFRFATVGADRGWLPSLWWSLGWCAAALVVALWLHRRYDRLFVDLL